METVDTALAEMLVCETQVDRQQVKSILILYDEKAFFIGDTCIRFDMIGLFKSFFPAATVSINWRDEKFTPMYMALLNNNPYLSKATNLSWDKIEFSAYDLVISITYEEEELLQMISSRYQHLLSEGQWKTVFFSMSSMGLNLTTRTLRTVFPQYPELSDYARKYDHQPQLYISQQEKEWANNWLLNNGLKNNEKLFIVLDSSSSRKKLLKTDVLKELLDYLLDKECIKILVFDEKNTGKEDTYRQLIGDEAMSKFIFAKGTDLRQALCILSSDFTRLIFGPCTGLLHCASGIYNNFVQQGMPATATPLMITYTGRYEKETENANTWWGTSPLVNCLLLKEMDGYKEIVLLHDLPAKERTNTADLLPCREYTADLLTEFLDSTLPQYLY